MLVFAALTLALVALGAHAEPPQPEAMAQADTASVETADVVWSYDTGG